MSKFLKIEVSKRAVTEVYIEVPDDYNIRGRVPPAMLKKAVEDTVSPSDWDDFGALDNLEIEGMAFVDEKTAREYAVLELEKSGVFLGITKIVDKPKPEVPDPNQLELGSKG